MTLLQVPRIDVSKIEDGGAALYNALVQPFPQKRIRWRVGSSGFFTKDNVKKPWIQALAYIDARDARERLNQVVGPMNWKMNFFGGPNGGVVCELSIRINGEWVTKQDGADASEIEKVKGGFSDAFKRAAVTWGVAEYLYDLGASYAITEDHTGAKLTRGKYSSEVKEKNGPHKEYVKWDPPAMSAQFLPSEEAPPPRQENNARSTRTSTAGNNAPAAGKPQQQPPAAAPAGNAQSNNTAVAPAAYKLPFGKKKNTPLGQLSIEEIEGAYQWAKDNNYVRAGFFEACEALIAAHASDVPPDASNAPSHTYANNTNSDFPGNYSDDDLPAALRDEDDDLPF